MATNTSSAVWYGRFLLFIAGMGGLLYGIDVGIIAAALLYLGKTISLTVEETSFIVAAVLGGSMFSSLVGGILADYIGRKRTLLYAILAYSFTTGLTALAWDWSSFLILRSRGLCSRGCTLCIALSLAQHDQW